MTVDVIIAGGGPTGLLLAAELCAGGARPLVLERRTEPDLTPKANGLVGQVVQLLDFRGLYAALAAQRGASAWLRRRLTGARLDRPTPARQYLFGGFPLDLRALAEGPLSVLPVPQAQLEEVLTQRAVELGAEIRRGHEVVGFTGGENGVTVEIAGPDGPYQVEARFLVGCDGAHSAVRKLAGIDFLGRTSTDFVSRNAHVVLPRSALARGTGFLAVPGVGRFPPFRFHRTAGGVFSFARLRPHLAPGVHLVNTYEWNQTPIDDTVPMSVAELRASLHRVLGVDLPLQAPPPLGPAEPSYVLRRIGSRNARIADRFRAGPVFVAGDAAHVLTGFGGPGLNLALGDAVNLGWKLAAELRGGGSAGVLDTYHSERHPVAERALAQADLQQRLLSPGAEVDAERAEFAQRLTDPAYLRHIAETVAGADQPYDMGPASTGEDSLVGRLAPDLTLTVEDRTIRLAQLMRTGRPVLLDLTAAGSVARVARDWSDAVDIVGARPARLGGPAALLIRPDGYVAWVGRHSRGDGRPPEHGLRGALSAWFGPGVSAAANP